jgi:acyl carrier protein
LEQEFSIEIPDKEADAIHSGMLIVNGGDGVYADDPQ